MHLSKHGTPRALGYNTTLPDLPQEVHYTPACYSERKARLSGNSNLNVHTWLHVEDGDLLDEGSWGLQVNDSLVDSHLVSVPSLRTLTVRGLSGGDLQDLGWHSNRTLLDNLVVVGVLDDVGTDLLQGLDLGGGQGDLDLVDLLGLLLDLLLVDWGRHV